MADVSREAPWLTPGSPDAKLSSIPMAAWAVTAAAYFTMAYLSLRTKLRVLTGHVLQATRRLFGIPDFRFYALADGIKAHLFGQKRGLYGCFSSRDPETGQRWLFSP